jgi:hypothetical protein
VISLLAVVSPTWPTQSIPLDYCPSMVCLSRACTERAVQLDPTVVRKLFSLPVINANARYTRRSGAKRSRSLARRSSCSQEQANNT